LMVGRRRGRRKGSEQGNWRIDDGDLY